MGMAGSFEYEDDGSIVMGDRKIYSEYMIYDSDSYLFGMMGMTEKEYSIPHSLKICFSDERIFGMQLTL